VVDSQLVDNVAFNTLQNVLQPLTVSGSSENYGQLLVQTDATTKLYR